jgi:type III restriction enzyme
LARTPNLDRYDLAEGQAGWPMVKDSLGNALIRPLVVMDEGHRAISEIAFQTLYGFNPCFVLELSATPKDVVATRTQSARPANVVVEVLGTELDREGMIKMPLNLDARQSSDWRDTLRAALERLNELERQARTFQADKGRYIRPIMLVKVERTGADQRDAGHIHARYVKEWLTTAASLGDAEIAIKTAETNDLNSPENQDLLAETNRVRVIVTKQALQEGWDCPFAYVLCEPIGSDATGGPHPASAACRAYWCRSTRRVLCGDSSRRDGRCCRGGEGWPGRGRPWRPGARDQGARCRHRW